MEDFKVTKKRDLGMKLGVFVLRFELCIRGVVFKIRDRFCVLRKWQFL